MNLRLILYTLLLSAPVWTQGDRLEPNQLSRGQCVRRA